MRNAQIPAAGMGSCQHHEPHPPSASMGDGCGWDQQCRTEGQEGKTLSCRAWQVTVMCVTGHKHAGLVTCMGWGWLRGG